MKTIYLRSTVVSFFTLAVLNSCSNPQPELKPVPVQEMSKSDGIKVDVSVLAMDRDTICGMNLTDGIADTATVNGKLYGFCCSGCKDDFLAMQK